MCTSPGTPTPGRAGVSRSCGSTITGTRRTLWIPWTASSWTGGNCACRWPATGGPGTRAAVAGRDAEDPGRAPGVAAAAGPVLDQEDPGPDPAQDVAIVDRGVGLIAAIVEMTGHVPEARRNEQANPRVALEAQAETETETKNTGNLAVEAGAILLNNLWGTSSEVGLKAPNLKVEQQTNHLRKLSEKDDYCSAFLFKGAVVCCNWCGEQWQSHGAVVSSGVLSSSRERQVPGIKIRVPA